MNAPFASRAILSETRDPFKVAHQRTADVEINDRFPRMPWMLRTYGQGRCTLGRGVPRYYASEQHARAVAKCWIDTGVSPADQLSVPPVTVKVSAGNPKLLSIVTKDGPWTADERAYVDACEREVGL